MRIGEFAELGFAVCFRMKERLSDTERSAFTDDWIQNAIEANELMFGGGGNDCDWEGVVALAGDGTLTEAHRLLIEDWLANSPQVCSFQIGPLFDVWNADK